MDQRNLDIGSRWNQDNNVEMYSTHNEVKSVVAARFIRNLKIESTNTWHQHQKICILIN